MKTLALAAVSMLLVTGCTSGGADQAGGQGGAGITTGGTSQGGGDVGGTEDGDTLRTVDEVASDLGCDLVMTSEDSPGAEDEYECGAVKIIDFNRTGLSPPELTDLAPMYATGAGEEVAFVEPLIFVVGQPADLPK